MKRGEIWWVLLEEPSGSEPGFHRPVLIVSSNAFNDSKIRTVLVVVITSNLRLAQAPGNIKLTRQSSKLPKESVINVSQLITVDKELLSKRVSKINSKQMTAVSEGLKLALAL